MDAKKFLVASLILLFAGAAFAANPSVGVYADANNLYPSRTNVINFTIADSDAPVDANVYVYYILDSPTDDSWTRTEITAATGTLDRNTGTYCSDGITSTEQLCSLTWTLPTGLDANYFIDVNVYDISTPDDANTVSATISIDSNACDTGHTILNDQVTLTRVCTGLGTDNNIGSETTRYSKNRQGGCSSNYADYSSPFNLTLGEFTVCYYSTDGLGNTESTQSFVHTADSNAYDIALLTELALAGLLLMVILGAVVLRQEDLSKELMIALTVAAVIIAIAIVIFGTVL